MSMSDWAGVLEKQTLMGRRMHQKTPKSFCFYRMEQPFPNREGDTPTSGGFRGYAGYAAAYPIDWTGCIL